MVKSSDSRQSDDFRCRCGPNFNVSASRSIPKASVNGIFVVVRDLFSDQTTQMEFVNRNDVIGQFSADQAYPSLCNTVLPWTAQESRFRLDAEVSNCFEDSAREYRVVVVDQESSRRLNKERFSNLLDHPRRGRMLGDVEVASFAAAMGDHEPDEEYLEADRGNDQEVHGRDDVAMVSKECDPPSSLVIASQPLLQ